MRENNSKYFDVERVAQYLGLSAKAVRHLVDLRKIPFRKPANYNRIFFLKAEVDQWLLSGETVSLEDVINEY